MAQKFMEALKAKGCRLALDDFGTGMSSFSYLKNLPVDYIKIDGQFIKNIMTGLICAEMASSTDRIARLMNVQTIAEGVENKMIWERLKTMGVCYDQGLVIAKPLARLRNDKTRAVTE